MTSRQLARALARAGLELAGPLGTGASGERLAARDADGVGWAVTLVGRELPREVLRARMAALARVTSPHVARVGPLLELRDGTAVALTGEVAGPDLATVCRARGPWRPGEVVTLVVPLAQALAELHRAGVAHGDVAPANVVLERDGRPVLVDLVCGARPDEAGTPGWAAPERAEGATAAADVHALGRLGLALLQTAGDADATGGPDGAAAEAARLRAVLEHATAVRPEDRPAAAALAERVYAACAPEPIRLPDPATLARLTLRRLATPDDATVLRPPPDAARPRGRHRRRARVPAPVLVGVVGVLLVAPVVALGRSGLTAGGAGEGGTAGAPPAPAHDGVVVPVPGAEPGAPGGGGVASHDPVAAAVRLTVRRAHALALGDRVALGSATVPGSQAARADARLAAQRRQETRGVARVRVDEVRLLAVEGERPWRPRQARVLVRADARVTTGDPADVVPTAQEISTDPAPPSSPAEPAPEGAAVVLVLVEGPGGWRVSAVEPAPAAPASAPPTTGRGAGT